MKAIAKIICLCLLAGTGYGHIITINNQSSYDIEEFTVVFKPDRFLHISRYTDFTDRIPSEKLKYSTVTLNVGKGSIQVLIKGRARNKVICHDAKVEGALARVTVVCKDK